MTPDSWFQLRKLPSRVTDHFLAVLLSASSLFATSHDDTALYVGTFSLKTVPRATTLAWFRRSLELLSSPQHDALAKTLLFVDGMIEASSVYKTVAEDDRSRWRLARSR